MDEATKQNYTKMCDEKSPEEFKKNLNGEFKPDKEPALVAFKVDDQEGVFNVWRYDTPQTKNVLFGYKADSEEDAISAAKEKLNV